jgi:hypothetical protein
MHTFEIVGSEEVGWTQSVIGTSTRTARAIGYYVPAILERRTTMKIFCKWFWRIFTHSVVAGVTSLIFFVYYHLPAGNTVCFDRGHFISENNLGDKVEFQQRVCAGFANSATVYLNLVSARTSKKLTFFSYERGNADPVVSWEGDHILVVDIPNVAAIDEKMDSAGDINIHYKIGDTVNR